MARFEVHISGEGLAAIDGEPLALTPDQSVHEAVLDRLQRYAVERAAVVEATVHDRFGTGHFVLAVAPDGSSRLLPPLETPDADADPDLDPDPDPDPVSPSAPGGGAVVPAELAGQVGRINALADAGRLDEAYALAADLRESLTGEAGAEDPRAVEARAVEAYLAHLRGDHRQAVMLALAVARIRCRAGDHRASDDVTRAAAAWQWLDDDRAAVVHGLELLHMWERLDHRGLLPPAHAQFAGQVRRRVDALRTPV
ncbi:hypothetical protein [Streptomyces sp. NPDC047000]|uniref:hypothetical protein n=1 Tax=Streptomyces sp. NPDC047000 TaxID=3155474 RepID=UPI00340C1A0F